MAETDRKKFESLPVASLRELAKSIGVKSVTKLKKDELVSLLVEAQEKASEKKPAKAKEEKPKKPARRRPSKKVEQAEEKVSEEKKEETSEEVVEVKAEEKKPARRGRKPSVKKEQVEIEKTSEATESASEVETAEAEKPEPPKYSDAKDCSAILEVMTEGYGFLRGMNYLSDGSDIYVSPSQIRRFRLKTGDMVTGKTRKNNPNDKYGALLFIEKVNGMNPEMVARRTPFEDLTPIFPNERIRLEEENGPVAMRIVDLFSPIGKGQRGMIVAQPKAGKTTLLKQVAKSVKASHPGMHIIVLLIDERPEEVTDMKESIEGDNVEVIYSTFDELPEHHKQVSEMTIERAKRLVEQGQDVMILLDSITRLSRAYNLTVPPSGRTLSGGLDPAALHMPKRFFGAARNMREGGSLTILATALVNTGSKMDDVVYEEFKGTGNMELVLDRKLSERRVFPAIDLSQSGTRKEDLLLTPEEKRVMDAIHRSLNGMRKDEATESILNLFTNTRSNEDFVQKYISRMRHN